MPALLAPAAAVLEPSGPSGAESPGSPPIGPADRLFPGETNHALRAGAALINTGATVESLPDLACLERFASTWGWCGDVGGDQAELMAVREVRGRLRHIWHGDVDEVAEIVNALLRQGGAVPQLVRHGGWNFHLQATPPSASLTARMAIDIALAVADVVHRNQLSRLRGCAFPGCLNVLADLSKNRSKRFCDARCANRAAVAAYRSRKLTER